MVRRYNLKGLEDLETFSTMFRKQREIGCAIYLTGVMLVFTPEFSLNILNFATVNGDAPPLRYLSLEEKLKGT